MSLSTLVHVKNLLNIDPDNTSFDDILQQCLAAATTTAQRYTKRPGLNSPDVSYTLYLDGTGRDSLRLPHYPVTGTSITVYEDPVGAYGTVSGSFSSSTLLTEGTDYVLRRDDPTGSFLSLSGIVQRLRSPNLAIMSGIVPSLPYGTLTTGQAGPRWAKAFGSVKVTFTAGYPALLVPDDLATAVAEIAAWIKRSGVYGNAALMNENLGEYSYGLQFVPLQSIPELGSARQILSTYRDTLVG